MEYKIYATEKEMGIIIKAMQSYHKKMQHTAIYTTDVVDVEELKERIEDMTDKGYGRK